MSVSVCGNMYASADVRKDELIEACQRLELNKVLTSSFGVSESINFQLMPDLNI